MFKPLEYKVFPIKVLDLAENVLNFLVVKDREVLFYFSLATRQRSHISDPHVFISIHISEASLHSWLNFSEKEPIQIL